MIDIQMNEGTVILIFVSTLIAVGAVGVGVLLYDIITAIIKYRERLRQ